VSRGRGYEVQYREEDCEKSKASEQLQKGSLQHVRKEEMQKGAP